MATQPVTLLPSGGLGQIAQFSLDYPPNVSLARNIAGLTFDAVISESHNSELEVTENPVESGVSIADHCFLRPLRVSISAVVSDLKMPSASNQYDGSPSGRARKAFEMLQQLQTDLATYAAQPFTVATGLRLYERMVVRSISATQDALTGSMLAFTAELQQVIIASTQYVTYVEPPKPARGKPTRQAAKPVDKGPQQPQPVTEPQKIGLMARGLNRVSKAIGGEEIFTGPPQSAPTVPQSYAFPGTAYPRETNLYRPIR